MRRFFETLLVIYAFFLFFYLVLRFLLQADWGWLLLLHNGAPYLFLPILLGFLIAVLMGARRIAGIYLLFLLAGLLWFAPILLPKFQGSNPAAPMKILSFNVFPENQELETATTWLLAQDADIILLQELPQTLPELEAAYPYFDYNPSDQSLAVFSRYPILVSSEFSLGTDVQQRLILDIAGQDVVFYNLHLLMPLNDREGDFLLFRYDESRRNQQISSLLSSIESETLPLILVGDFNMSEWSPMYQELAAELQDAYRLASWGIGATWPAGASEELPDFLPRLVRLDYLWYRGAFLAISASVGIPLGSDHLPLVLELSLGANE